MKYENRADLLIAAGESIKMQENAGIEPMCKLYEGFARIKDLTFCDYNCEFPLAVVEGKPVFVGDELYASGFGKFIVGEKTFYDGEWFLCCSGYSERGGGESHPVVACSWNPPKPAIVMVELLREDAEYICSNQVFFCHSKGQRAVSYIRKALEKA